MNLHNPIKYINHLNETITFGTRELFINDTDLMNYSWDFDSDFSRINRFKKDIQEKELSVSVYSRNQFEFIQQKNKLFEIFEKDILANMPGQLWVGDYHLNCYVREKSVGVYNRMGNYVSFGIKIVTDSPVWVKETSYTFYIHEDVEGDNSYPYGYSFGYSNNLNSQRILSSHFTDSNFKLVIYGAVNNPTVFINGHPYTVNTDVLEGEYLTISSLDKTVIKRKNNGDTVNEFNKRSKEYSVFEKIKQGSNTVSYDGTFDFGVILFEERSEPKWT